MTKMIESTVQNAAIEWLQNLGYIHQPGKLLKRDLKKVVLEDDLKAFLQNTYPELPASAIAETMAVFTQHEGMDVDNRNHDFHRKMTQGIDISWKDAQGKEYAKHIYPINFDAPKKNRFVCADEVSIVGRNNRRTDLLIFINGLPVVVFEFKNAFDAKVGVDNAHNQIGHYIQDIPQLFDYNAITVVSDGMQALHGMYNSDMEWFAPWKSLDGDDTEQKVELQLETLLSGLFPKATLLNYLNNFIFHEDHNSSIIKKGAKYHQYWGICKSVESAQANIKPLGDGRLGVIWHTQGSGKSISMAILTGILRSLPELKNPTIVIQVDRSDLDLQLYENFVLCKDLVGTVKHANNTDKLREYLNAEDGCVIFTTIEKFRLKDLEEGKEREHPVLSQRYNLIVMADEAHRTQYGFKEGGFAQNIRRALPNASFIGFTGTPVDGKGADTELIFGETIHTYDIKQAVDDGATMPIHYEPKMVPLNIKGNYSKVLNDIDEEDEGEDENVSVVWAAIEDAAGADDRVKTVATEILKHYKSRTDTLDGKAMIVCMSRKNCVKMYDAITALSGCPETAVIMTTNVAEDPETWKTHVRTSKNMESIKKRFRTADDPLKIVIVRDMWLTGFDAPCAHTMYVDKIMKGHNLMQAIARVNRVFGDKPNGLIVDFIGISDFLAKATKKYTGGGGKGKPTFDIKMAVSLCLEQLQTVKAMMGDFDLESINNLSDGERMKWSTALINNLLKTDALTDLFLKEEKKLSELVAMTNSDEQIWNIQEEVVIIQKIRNNIRKIKMPPGLQRKKNERIKDLISKSIESNGIVDLAAMYNLDKINISILDDSFQAMVKEKGSENIKIELLRRIINDELEVRITKNIKKNRKLKDQLEDVLSKYHKNGMDSIAAIKHLVNIAAEFKNDNKRTQELGLSEDELAFYDLLSDKQELINTQGPIQDLVHKIVKSVKKNLYLDWKGKKEAESAIRLAVKKELKGKVPFSQMDNLLKEVIKEAEGQYANWPMVG